MAEAQRDEQGRWVPGRSANPKGRPKGSRNRLQEVKAELVGALEDLGGRERIVAWVEEKPDERLPVLLRLVVSVLPKDMSIESYDSRRSVTEFSTGELLAALSDDSAASLPRRSDED